MYAGISNSNVMSLAAGAAHASPAGLKLAVNADATSRPDILHTIYVDINKITFRPRDPRIWDPNFIDDDALQLSDWRFITTVPDT